MAVVKDNMADDETVDAPVMALPATPHTPTLATSTPSVTHGPTTQIIKIGQSFTYEDTTITFVDVSGDSRCPADVDCFWAGEITTQFKLKNKDGEQVVEVKNTKPGSASKYKISIQDVKPATMAGKTIEKKNYTLTVMVEHSK
ncbi:MAG: hypothetical protein RJB39_758 [Candidatus Parcubacteria bacterium]